MKLALMAELSRLGNDEPRNWRNRRITDARKGVVERQRKMTNSARSIADITAFSSLHAFPVVFVLAASTLAATLGAADARGARSRAYDGTGTWSSSPGRAIAVRPTAPPSLFQAGDFIPPEVAK
jgi:hypothetical protein